MKRSCFLLALCLSAVGLAGAQDLRWPRDPEKLLDRVQKFWAATISNQRVRALEFILPDKKDLFLSEPPLSAVAAKAIGVDLTTDANRAGVRMSIQFVAKELGTQPLTRIVTDTWVWKGGNWYFDLQKASSPFAANGVRERIDASKVQEQIARSFELLQDSIDLGTLTQGESRRLEIPIKYTGDLPLKLESALPNPLVDLEYTNDPITSASTKFVLSVATENWEGPFTLPFPLKIVFEDVAVERTVTLKGNVFAPLAFRQSPPNGPIELGHDFSVFIQNNTDEKAEVDLISVDARLEVMKKPDSLLPHQEAEVVLRPRPMDPPAQMYVKLKAPLQGRDTYTYRFRNSRP